MIIQQMMCKVIGGFYIYFKGYDRHNENCWEYLKLPKIKIIKLIKTLFEFLKKSNANYGTSSVTSRFFYSFGNLFSTLRLCIQDPSRRCNIWKKKEKP